MSDAQGFSSSASGLDNVMPPLGFGELQAIDLKRWKGGAKDPFLLDLVAACRAKLDGQPIPPSKGPSVRLYRRLRAGLGRIRAELGPVVVTAGQGHVQVAGPDAA